MNILKSLETFGINKIIIVICAIYLLNPTFGFDIIPDNFPITGNLDEVIATFIAFKLSGMMK